MQTVPAGCGPHHRGGWPASCIQTAWAGCTVWCRCTGHHSIMHYTNLGWSEGSGGAGGSLKCTIMLLECNTHKHFIQIYQRVYHIVSMETYFDSKTLLSQTHLPCCRHQDSYYLDQQQPCAQTVNAYTQTGPQPTFFLHWVSMPALAGGCCQHFRCAPHIHYWMISSWHTQSCHYPKFLSFGHSHPRMSSLAQDYQCIHG